MPRFGTKQLDIRDQNVAVEQVLEVTENPGTSTCCSPIYQPVGQ